MKIDGSAVKPSHDFKSIDPNSSIVSISFGINTKKVYTLVKGTGSACCAIVSAVASYHLATSRLFDGNLPMPCLDCEVPYAEAQLLQGFALLCTLKTGYDFFKIAYQELKSLVL